MFKNLLSSTELKLFLVGLVLCGLVTKIEGTVICREDYNRTNYNLFCADPSQVVYVNVLTASFVLKNVQSNCYAQSSLILNASTSLVTNICNYCFNKDPCVINQQILDQNGLFNVPTYNVDSVYNSQPISINILYQCVDRVDLSYYPSQANLCASPTTITKYVSTTGTTPTSTYYGGGGSNTNTQYTTRPPYTVTVPTIATNTYYPIYPNGYIYCLSGAPRLASLAELKFILAPLSFLVYKLVFAV